jgi:hypothetical protein
MVATTKKEALAPSRQRDISHFPALPSDAPIIDRTLFFRRDETSEPRLDDLAGVEAKIWVF